MRWMKRLFRIERPDSTRVEVGGRRDSDDSLEVDAVIVCTQIGRYYLEPDPEPMQLPAFILTGL